MASSVQQNVYKVLSSIGCTQVCISKGEQNSSFRFVYAYNWKLFIYIACHLNFLIKVTFVALLSFGVFGPITEFFDWIAILLWILIISMILTSERLFYRKYPFFEILCAGWSYQENLYENLIDTGEEFKRKLHNVAYSRIFLQTWIAVVGSAAMLFQYLSAPKYCVFTYSAISEDTLPLYILFGAHELLFIFHGWQFYGGIIYVSSCFGAELIHCINTLTEVLRSLSSTRRSNAKRFVKKRSEENSSAHFNLRNDDVLNASINNFVEPLHMRKIKSRLVTTLANIMLEYRKLTIWSDRINEYASYSFLTIHGLSYCQMVSDVFVMIQLLRMPETDVVSVIFFAEDAGVCMYMLFKVFKSMSFVTAASIEFHAELRIQLQSARLANRDRQYLRKFSRSLRKVQMQIGPARIGPRMVGNSMMGLLNYYICAAMW